MKNTVQIPEWKLERYALGELPPTEMEEVREAVQSDCVLARRLEELQQSNDEILLEYSPKWLAHQLRARTLQTGSARPQLKFPGRRFAISAKAAALAVALLFVLLPLVWRYHEKAPQPGMDSDTRIKGSASLALFRKVPSGSERLSEGSLAKEGDTIQIAYQGADLGFGVIVSLDGRGVVTLHLPESGTQSARLEKGRLVPLASAYQLDNAPRWECFYFITAAESFPVDLVLKAAREAKPGETPPDRLPMPDSFTQSTFLLRKAPTP